MALYRSTQHFPNRIGRFSSGIESGIHWTSLSCRLHIDTFVSIGPTAAGDTEFDISLDVTDETHLEKRRERGQFIIRMLLG